MSEKKSVLLVGEHPFGVTGNSHMMLAILEQIDYKQYDVVCYANDAQSTNVNNLLANTQPFRIVSSCDFMAKDEWGVQKLATLITSMAFECVFFIGVDIWRYAGIYSRLDEVRKAHQIRYGSIFPYDLQSIRPDWVKLIQFFDYKLVYSKYGEEILKPVVPDVEYFRPALLGASKFMEKTKVDRKHFKAQLGLSSDVFLFGFVGCNQFRKDPQVHIRAFSELIKEFPFARLYLHTEIQAGVYNLKQYVEDCKLPQGSILSRRPGVSMGNDAMPEVFTAFDCLINCSLQEGLSWTPVEAMLTGIPVILSKSTAQTELVVHGKNGFLVPCEVPTYLTLVGEHGGTWIDAKRCRWEDVHAAMRAMMLCATKSPDKYKEMCVAAAEFGAQWVAGVNDFNKILDRAYVDLYKATRTIPTTNDRVNKVLFVQHSSAGDILMTTRCLKGLCERYEVPRVDYMTQPQYMNIVENNPYVETIHPYIPNYAERFAGYKAVINVHAERIAPGGWGRNCNQLLSDFYWNLLKVEPDDFHIYKRPVDLPMQFTKPIMIVHTTGGDPRYRSYKYMSRVCTAVSGKYHTVQVGGKDDYPAGAELDLRGKLSYQESAYVVSLADCAVTVDSFISHLCGAFGVSQICLFGSGNANVVKPKQMGGKLLCLSPDYINVCPGLGPCSGAVQCPTPCTSRHDPNTIIQLIKEEF